MENSAPSPLRGSICEPYTLYETLPDLNGNIGFSEEPPAYPANILWTPKSSQYALTVHKVRCYDGQRDFRVSSIVVQSQPLRNFLASAIEKYPGLNLTLDPIVFREPFEPFVHRWEQLVRARNGIPDVTTKAHVDLLFEILDAELHQIISQMRDLLPNALITFDLLWTIFQPCIAIFAMEDGRQRAFTIKCAGIGSKDLDLDCFSILTKYVDYDGNMFGYRERTIDIHRFEGELPITSFPAFPLAYHPEESATRRDLVARGKLWEEYKGYHFRYYKGPVLETYTQPPVNSRIVIDANLSNILSKKIPEALVGISDGLSDEHRLIATPILRGFSLQDKLWLSFFVDLVQDVVWNKQDFASEMLWNVQDLKEVALAFYHAQGRDTFHDSIEREGRGLVISLEGNPGVGNAFRAERIVEALKAPFYALRGGDLGSRAELIATRLKEVLLMTSKWKAVLLIREADVFMEKRNKADFATNELVSIFLGFLDRYEGIAFLTSSCVIDPVFESCIYSSIDFDDEEEQCWHEGWTQLLGNTSTGGLSQTELKRLSRITINSRKIRNVIRTANLMAQNEGRALTYWDVQTGFRAIGYGIYEEDAALWTADK